MKPQDLDLICLSCWITTESECADTNSTKATRAICPRRRLERVKLPPEQMERIRRISKARGYPLKHFVRMVEIQAERNSL